MRAFEVRFGLPVLALSSLILFACAVPRVATAAGPWKAQVVDAETKQPLEGVVVLAWWTRRVRSFGGPSSEYHYSEEVLTSKDGRFAVSPRSFSSLNPFVFFRGPSFLIFKPGYGRAIWPGGKQREVWPEEKPDDIIIELPRLKTWVERREYITRGLSTPDIPLEKTPLLQKAIREERMVVGYRD